ncbi:hypothetical protein [uncultured Cocleimonas sp.]|uniref:hypothetical protein n=1 Tax=uncultured Cocleimonas sp. TaxID=1051587 RepID=UPI0026198724|nr:hypothetical protein [uncultured Cocleimonas sp.]
MNTYSLIIAIFTFAMVSIIDTHKNTPNHSTDEFISNANSKSLVTIKTILNETDEFDLFDDEFSATRHLHHQITHPGLLETETINNTVQIKTEIAVSMQSHMLDNAKKNALKENATSKRLAFYKQLNSRNKSRKTDQIVSTSDIENENIVAETTFIFSKPTEVAPNVLTSNVSLPVTSKTIKQNIKLDTKLSKIAKVGYWDTVHSIESKQGKLLYRPRNKSRSCTYTTSPCGHHQLTVQALKDIGCKSIQCRKDRLNYSKSLAMSKKLLAKNEKRLKKNGYENLEDYQRYLIHQQGATGIKVILGATKGEKLLNKTIKKNMANNSPYSYRQLNRMGSRLAANIFLSHWKSKWEKEKQLVAGVTLASNQTSKDYGRSIDESSDQISVEPFSLPLFNESEIQLALNYKF